MCILKYEVKLSVCASELFTVLCVFVFADVFYGLAVMLNGY
jgi:hypothetical protein